MRTVCAIQSRRVLGTTLAAVKAEKTAGRSRCNCIGGAQFRRRRNHSPFLIIENPAYGVFDATTPAGGNNNIGTRVTRAYIIICDGPMDGWPGGGGGTTCFARDVTHARGSRVNRYFVLWVLFFGDFFPPFFSPISLLLLLFSPIRTVFFPVYFFFFYHKTRIDDRVYTRHNI